MIKKHMPLIRIGVVDFSEPTLLLLGDAPSLLWLSDHVANREQIALDELPHLNGKAHVSLRITPTADAIGELRRKLSAFEWSISAEESRQVAEQIKEVASSSVPAHAYLDPAKNATGIQMMVSMGEYDANRVLSKRR